MALGTGYAGTPGHKNCGEKNVAKCATAQGLGNAHAFPPPDFLGVYASFGAQEKNRPGIRYLTQKQSSFILLTVHPLAIRIGPVWASALLLAAGLSARTPQKTTFSSQETKITAANWQQNPKIIEIRELVTSTDAELKKRAYKISERRLQYCRDGELFTVRRIARDAKGAVPWYEHYSEGQDESWDFHYYYDGAGRLRFVLADARSANGTREQLRVYFDEAGKRLWKTEKLLKGTGCPGCFSGYYDSDEKLAFDPAKDFANEAGCKEAKPKTK